MSSTSDSSQKERWLHLRQDAASQFDGTLPEGKDCLSIMEANLSPALFDQLLQHSPELKGLMLEEVSLPGGLPPTIYKLAQLQTLSLNNIATGDAYGEDEDMIHELPAGIAAMQALRHLELFGNELQELCEDLHQLEQLVVLDISSNALSAKAITALPPALRILDLSYNPMGSLPEALRQLHHLEELDLSSCQLSSLPEWLAELPLKTLRITNNKDLQGLEYVFAIPTLEFLDLSGCELNKLPDDLSQASNLRELNLTYNPLGQLKANISQLSALQVLTLNRCSLSYVHESLAELKELRALILSNNQLSKLPRGLGRLDKLEKLWVSNNALWELPDMSGLSALKMADFSRNKLQAFPLSLYACSSLEVLELNWNNIDQIGPSVAKLQNLRTLSVYSNYLLFFNDNISELKQLQGLNLGFTRIKKLPDLSGCTSLVELNLAGLHEIEDMYAMLKTLNCPWITNLTLTGCQGLHDLPPNLDTYKQLKRINVNKTAIDQEKLKELRARFPNTVVWSN